jgi:uncharacterized SAM-binding protein YcdF (DUF218 family)
LILFVLFTNSVIFLEFCGAWEVPGKKISSLGKYDVGIVLTGMAEYNTDLEELSIRRGGDRIWQALNLYHKGKIKKILITGDNGYVTDRGLHEATQFKKVLVSWGIPEQDIITEERSRNTYENAVETKKILERSYPHLKKRLLITSGTHMKRSLACFEKLEFPCESFSTDLHTGPKSTYYWDQYLIPNVSVLSDWNKLTKEWFGYLTYDIIGYL